VNAGDGQVENHFVNFLKKSRYTSQLFSIPNDFEFCGNNLRDKIWNPLTELDISCKNSFSHIANPPERHPYISGPYLSLPEKNRRFILCTFIKIKRGHPTVGIYTF